MMGFVENVDQTSPTYYNDSSATGFVNQIKRLIGGESPNFQASRAFSADSPRKRIPRKHCRQQQLVDYVLPSRQRADYLLAVYRRLVSTLYPFLDFDEIETLYQRLWTGEDLGPDSVTFICLINVVFSLASNLDTSVAPQDRIVNAEVFYDRVQEVLPSNLVHEPSMLQVQCFLLLGLYLQSSSNPEQCWIFVGYAIRIAQSLKLDIPSTSANEPLCRREAMRRVWHCCVLMDETLSMTFGRPPMIPSRATRSVPLPLPHSDATSCLCATQALSRTDATDYHFFIETLKLYSLMNQTLQILYDSDTDEDLSNDPTFAYFGISGTNSVGNLLEMDHKLSTWYQNLPPHLRHDEMAGKHPIHHRQANIVAIRYSHVRILLFRPILARYCSKDLIISTNSASTEDHLPGKIALQFSVACVNAALRTIGHFDMLMAGQKVEELDDQLPAWWYTIFYVYTAATVLVAARLNHSLLAEVTEQAVHQSLTKAMNILSRLDVFSPHARRCSAAIALLLDQVMHQSNHQETAHGNQRAERISSPSAASWAHEAQSSFESPSAFVGMGVHTNDWAPSGREPELSRRAPPTVENIVRHFNTSGIHVNDFWDMSWLKVTSMPSQLY
ncbi:Fungal specific transcription factor domain-containing protein [Cladophialophora immunda]|nr:Fungal specific transcription factor domain-containing protein [Cladophialophora immunda]